MGLGNKQINQELYSQHFIFFATYEGHNKLECYITRCLKSLQGTNITAYLAKFISYEEYEVSWIWPRGCIHNTSFSSLLMKGPNKLDCYITLRITAYLDKFISCEEYKVLWIWPLELYSRHFIFFATYEGHNKLVCFLTLDLQGTFTTAHWAHSYVMKNIKHCEYGPTIFIPYVT